MISRVEKERIKCLLRETITLLCKNGLPYRREFNLEALIGITLDKKDVLLISLNELIRGHSISSTESCPVITNATQDNLKKHDGKSSRGRGRPPKRRKLVSPSEMINQDEENNHSAEASLPVESHPARTSESDPVTDVPEGAEASSEDSSSSESECGSDDLTEDQKSLLAKMKEAVNQQIKKESNNLPSRDNTGLQPMDMEESRKIWQKAFEMARSTRQAESKRKKGELSGNSENKDKCDVSEQEPQDSAESMPSPMCHICGKTMSTEKNLTKHVRRHLGMFSVYCDECGKGFFDRTDLDSHTAKHKDTKLYQCDICGRSYSHKRGLYKHIRKDHQNDENKDIDDIIKKASSLEKPATQPPPVVSAPVSSPTVPYPEASGHGVMSHLSPVTHTPNMSHMSEMPQPADLSQQSHLSQLHQPTNLSQTTSLPHPLALAQASVMSPAPPPPMVHPHTGLSPTPVLPLSSSLAPHFQHQQHPPGIHQPPYPRY